MNDQDRTPEELLRELAALQRRLAEAEAQLERNQHAEAALAESEARYRLLAESTDDIIAVTDPSGTLRYANRAAALQIGLSPDEIVGKRQQDLFPPPVAAKHVERIERVCRTGEAFQEDERFQFGPEVVWLNVHLIPLHDARGQVTSVMTVSRNITVQKGAEEVLQQARDELEAKVKDRTAELSKANEQLQAIYDGMFDGLLIVDLKTRRIVRANPSICRMLGYPEAELLSMSLADIHPAEAMPAIVERLRARAEGRSPGHAVWRVIRKDGGMLHADIASHAVTYNGRPCVAGFFRDITERKRANEALRQERRTLKHMLRASDHERQLIAYDIHDGLAQHLAGAVMQFQTFEHLRGSEPQQAADAFHAGMTLLRQAHLEARRLISGVRPPILDESGIVAAIAHLVGEWSTASAPRIEFHSKVRFHRLAPILENAIYRIVQEGLSNARKHSKSEEVHIRLRQRGSRVRIEIHDSGTGFDPHAIPDTGYGLRGIRERARVLGGKCRVQSKPGEGTALAVELPVVVHDEGEPDGPGEGAG